MNKREFVSKFPNWEDLVVAAFNILEKQKGLPVSCMECHLKEVEYTEDNMVETRVIVNYANYKEEDYPTIEIIEMLFTEKSVSSDGSNNIWKVHNQNQKIILRIAWRVWANERKLRKK